MALIRQKKQFISIELFSLAICAYAIGTTEFVAVGLVPDIATDLSIKVSKAGYTISLYAIGVAVGAPFLTAITSRFRRNTLLVLLLAFFILANLIAFISTNLTILLVARFLSGLSHGVFFGIASTIAIKIVDPERSASAIAMVFSGLTLAIISGVPFGTYIGQKFGWRFAFLGVAVLGIMALITVILLFKKRIEGTNLTVSHQLKPLQSKAVLVSIGVTLLGYGGTFIPFTYLSVLLSDIAGFPKHSISTILFGYGCAMAFGNLIGGRLANKHTYRSLIWMFTLQTIVLISLTFALDSQIATLIILIPMGVFAFSNVPALQFYIVNLTRKRYPGTEDVVSALNISGFNLGVAIASVIGGLVIESNFGLVATPWVGGMMVLSGLALLIISRRI